MANDTQVKHRSNKKQSVSKVQDRETNQQAAKMNNKKQTVNEKPANIGNQKSQDQYTGNDKNKETKNEQTRQLKSADTQNKNGKNRAGLVDKPNGKRNDSTDKQNGIRNSSSGKQIDRKTNSSDKQSGKRSESKQKQNGHSDKSPNKSEINKSPSDSKKKIVENKKQAGNTENKSTADKKTDNDDHEVNHKEQSGKFETAFNRIHKALREMVKETESDAFVELLYSGYKNHSLIRKYKSELHQFAKLRNAIVHERVNADYYIAEPHIEVVEQIEEICREFEKPQTALSIATSPVFYYYEDAYLKDVLKVINKFDFTRFPVYDRDDKYVALLTSTEIIQWMAKHFSSEVIHFEDVRIKELLTKGKNYFVTFVTEDASLYEIEELFERYHTRGKKLQAVIITETGDRHGKPIGVITPWDLLESDTAED